MAIQAATVLTWDGTKPLRSNVSAHSTVDLSFVEFVDLVSDAAQRIRKRRGRGTQIGATATAGAAITAIHEIETQSAGVTTYRIVRAFGAAMEFWTGAAWSAETLPYTPTSGVQWIFRNFANRCFAVNGDTDATKGQMIAFDGTTWRLVGIGDPVTPALYTLTGAYNTGSVTATVNVVGITGSIPAIWDAATMNGKPIDINGIRYTIDTITVAGNGTTIPAQANLTENFKETTSAGLPYRIYHGVMSWNAPMRYSWAWRNSTTKHVSNRAPATEITETNQVSRGVTLTIPGSAANTAAFNAGYDQIVIFRTYAEGNRLIAIDDSVLALSNNGAGTAIVFTETAATSLDRSLSGIAAPYQTNTKPPTGCIALEVWLGRLWVVWVGNATNTPRTMFSAIANEISMGRPEECFPVLFARSGIPQPKGLVMIASDGISNSLVIQSTNGDYTLQGYDNFTFTDPYQLGNRSTGGFEGGAINVDGSLVQLYLDRRFIDGGGTDVGFPIQNKLKAITASAITKSRVFRFAYDETDALFLTVPLGGATINTRTWMFDLDLQRMNEWSFGFSAAATVHNAGALEMWVGDGIGNVYALQKDGAFQDATGNYTPTFTTNILDFGERPRILSHAEIFVNPAAAAEIWTLTIYRDEEATGVAYQFYPNPEPEQNAQGSQLIYKFDSPLRGNRFQAKITFPTTANDAYIEAFNLGFDEEASTAEAAT